MITQTGMFSVVGRPNAGKSTLTNSLCHAKVAIVSNKPQTTRNRITGVLNHGEFQMVFLDTPGLHKPQNSLGDFMVKIVNQTVTDVEAAIILVEPVARIGIPEQILIDRVKKDEIPSILVINKIDTIKKEELLEIIKIYSAEHSFDAIIPVCARSGEGTAELIEELKKFCIESPQLFPDGMVSDQPEKQLIAEIIREKTLYNLEQEVPHGIAIEIEKMEDRENGTTAIYAAIYCERKTHKGILIGKNGDMLKKIGSQARYELEKMLGGKVYLELWVKIKEDWRNNPNQIRNFGYEEE